MSEPINIAFVFDDKFSDLCKVAIYSIVKNTQSSLAIYIVDCGIAENNRNQIAEFAAKYENILFLNFKKPERIDAFEKFPKPSHFSSAVFYRLALGKTFPDLKRIIYLDCDVIADGDIKEFWNVDLQTKSFGAMNDEINFFPPEDLERRKNRAGIPLERIYMSSGVLLIDLEKFERDRVFERILEFVGQCKKLLTCPEQDAMNICIHQSEYFPISPRFNFTPFSTLSKQCLQKNGAPLLIHYSFAKPWLLNKRLVEWLCILNPFSYDIGFIKKYWKYSDEIDKNLYPPGSVRTTITFFYKRVFGKIEYFIAKKIRNRIAKKIRKFLNKDCKCVP
ncbi:MAG: glycosyltransferase family 8 protein [Puniceicoccales bacterium]|jgi:lipopolysaccharide biosynthesis glycosyltransferase|nr:glycosyltransferase family 8 protein [Puniceicoccales bacterium]